MNTIKIKSLTIKIQETGLTATFINSPPHISFKPFAFYLTPIVWSSGIRLLPFVVVPSSSPALGLDQLLYCNVFVDLTLERRRGFRDNLGEGIE